MRSRHSQEGKLTDGSVSAALLRARFRWKGWYQARRDVRKPVDIDRGGPDGMLASSPFIRELRTTARRAADQQWATLEVEQARLIAELGRLAAAVVRYGPEETVHHLRFWRGLTAWDSAARRARKRLNATCDGLDQIQDAYWSGMVRGHPELVHEPPRSPRAVPRPEPITCAGLWPPTSRALLTGWDDADPTERIPTVLDEAIEIVLKMAASPPRWQRGDGSEDR